ncbi:MAG: DUF805 domain-containing protein [Dethiobacter sp.]|nr:DUF805 domain-containing protein [Dethiobacter sp.]
MNWYLEVLKKYAVFSGRARRKEYWMFFLINLIIAVVLSFISDYLYYLYVLAVFIPGLAVSVRRLHDIGKSGWWFFISLIPIAGWIWYIVLMATNGQLGENQYGPNPKESEVSV